MGLRENYRFEACLVDYKASQWRGKSLIVIAFVFLPVALGPNAGHGLLTTTHHSLKDSSGRVISASQRPLPDNTQHSQETDIHAPGGTGTHNLSRRAAVELCIRPRSHWERHNHSLQNLKSTNWISCFLNAIFRDVSSSEPKSVIFLHINLRPSDNTGVFHLRIHCPNCRQLQLQGDRNRTCCSVCKS